MSQNEQGTVYAFRLSGSRMRQSAAQLRRQGQTLDALALVRRAAEQDDTPAAWQALAAELRTLGCWEAASGLLARVLSREPHQPGAWIDMARCMKALGQTDTALDCAYHQLQEDPWSPGGDAARDLLAELEQLPEEREPHRTPRLIQRGMVAWQSGNRETGERLIRRALRIAADKERLLVTTAMMCMLEMDFAGALRYLPRALRLNPDDPRTLTALSTLYHQRGKRRLARGLLQRAGKNADSVLAEDGFLTAAWAQDAWPEMQEYLDARMKRLPYRIPLLTARATMACEQGAVDEATQRWKTILAVDPDDRNAATMIAWSQRAPEYFLNLPGMLPRPERQRQLVELKSAAEGLTMEKLLQAGTPSRRWMDWFIASSDGTERQYATALLENSGEVGEVVPYLKELLCRPFLRHDVRQWALVRLAEMGCREELLILVGDHYSLIACQPVDEKKQRQPWRSFLAELLRETRRYRQANEIADFAAQIWQGMTGRQRMDAAGAGCGLWCKAVEILYLRMTGREQQAARVAADMPLSPRRISRVLRQIGRSMLQAPVTE